MNNVPAPRLRNPRHPVPKGQVYLGTKLPPDIRRWVQEQAQATGRSTSAYLRYFLLLVKEGQLPVEEAPLPSFPKTTTVFVACWVPESVKTWLWHRARQNARSVSKELLILLYAGRQEASRQQAAGSGQ